jgi:uncharacterized protein YegP (UPF0339 family)
MRFEYWKSAEGKWCWHLRAPAEILARGRAHSSKDDCMAAIRRVKAARTATALQISVETGIAETDARPVPHFRIQPV